MANARFKKLTDLYVRKIRVDLPEGTDIYVRALNAFEKDECVDAAQVARSRIIMALKEAGNERLKVEARFEEFGPDDIRAELADSRLEDKTGELVNSIRDDPEWAERIAILERTDPDEGAKPLSSEEQDLLNQLNTDFFNELQARRTNEQELQEHLIDQMSDEEVQEAYLAAWLEKRGRKEATEEYQLTEIYLGTQWGDGERVFDSKKDVRETPKELYDAIVDGLAKLQMEDRDPKDSGSVPSSSNSSPSPSAAGESGSSTSTETPTQPRGTSPQLSTTP